ncbi:hypothetical protein NDU88_005921 [Pleurodeles waltl]|uniref:Uncharacterized protein n=1 Tax=Pleurodeles waltl TaxID=8319 RepID=A0AAV7QG45_PLEWA|nr:hypothetical protein NDU88_005921 [Pleurodeles waltl]
MHRAPHRACQRTRHQKLQVSQASPGKETRRDAMAKEEGQRPRGPHCASRGPCSPNCPNCSSNPTDSRESGLTGCGLRGAGSVINSLSLALLHPCRPPEVQSVAPESRVWPQSTAVTMSPPTAICFGVGWTFGDAVTSGSALPVSRSRRPQWMRAA